MRWKGPDRTGTCNVRFFLNDSTSLLVTSATITYPEIGSKPAVHTGPAAHVKV